jgi:hypothetical protein
MGTCYFFFREDTKTGYDLGKVYGWSEFFGDDPWILKVEDVQELAGQLDKCLAREGYRARYPLEWVSTVMTAAAVWSDGQPVRLVSEYHALIEDVVMEGYPNFTNRKWITGPGAARGP